MIATLPIVSKEHEDRLLGQIDRLPAIADSIGSTPVAALRERVDEISAFMTNVLVPHVDAAERALYPELERLMQNRHSMTPMRHEHEQIRSLVASLDRSRAKLADGHFGSGEAVALRRVLFQLYSLLKVHLAEERLYVDLIEHGISAEADAVLAAALEHPAVAAA
jgi:hemerythrin-like domain-containing protein